MLKTILTFILFAFTTQSFASSFIQLEDQLRRQFNTSVFWLGKNVIRDDVNPGAIIAAPSVANPNYYYHWVRDAALTFETLLDLNVARLANLSYKKNINAFFLDHIYFNHTIQRASFRFGGLGEPKFNVDGSSYTEPWGRPQNDGPALRASSLIKLYYLIQRENWPNKQILLKRLYEPKLPTTSIIKLDLEFVAHHWREPNFDLWEEVFGSHFYTLMSQRKAMLDGAKLAELVGDPGAAQFYAKQFEQMSMELERFWDPKRGFIVSTMLLPGHGHYKSHLDVSIILAVLHSGIVNSNFSFTDPRVLASFDKLNTVFKEIYSVNKTGPGVAIGRYPEDRYDGYRTDSYGNPWVLATAGFAEFLYQTAFEIMAKPNFRITMQNKFFFEKFFKNKLPSKAELAKKLISQGDQYLQRVLRHANPDGSLSEQINRNSGFMQGAPNLTWSHASFIDAFMARQKVISLIVR
ncbi:MAG: glycoside hydrolase family 15 protein [Oligoflexia bacterium]|nr:glycoside hydrolase family 15 protein [Oligoflexia bacterium]